MTVPSGSVHSTSSWVLSSSPMTRFFTTPDVAKGYRRYFASQLGEEGVLLLTAGPSEAFLHLRRRILALWDTAWRDAGRTPPSPAVVDQHVAMAGPEDAESFLAAAGAARHALGA